jgi:hypothetical protein
MYSVHGHSYLVFALRCGLCGDGHGREQHASSETAYEVEEDPCHSRGVGLEVDHKTVAERRECPSNPHNLAVPASLCDEGTSNLSSVSLRVSEVHGLLTAAAGATVNV